MGALYRGVEHMEPDYDPEYRQGSLPGMSLMDDVATEQEPRVSYPVSERIPVLPRLLSLIPGRNPRNLQRAHYLKILQQRHGRPPPPGLETEWRLLLMAGHGGIGHVDVFADDRAAIGWYAEQGMLDAAVPNRSSLWHFLRQQVLDETDGAEAWDIEGLLGPTPSVGGMIPKLLVSLEPDLSGDRFHPPDSPGKVDVLLKIEPPEYRGLLALESLCLSVHERAGFEVPRWRRFEHDGLNFLAIERFDRDDGLPLPMESLFSVIATGNWAFQDMGDILLEELGDVFSRLHTVITLPTDTQEQCYLRFLMAFLTGNGDLHLENLSLLGGKRDCRLAPVYDPAPMRAWPRHNLVSAIPYEASLYHSAGDAFVRLGQHFGLKTRAITACCERALAATSDFPEQVLDLMAAPSSQREQLSTIARNARKDLRKQL